MKRIVAKRMCITAIMAVSATACGRPATQASPAAGASQAQVSPLPSPASPTASTSVFRKVASLASGPQQAKSIDDGKVLQFYLTVFSDSKQFENLQGQDLKDKLKGDLDKELLLMVEWGVYPSSGITVDVSDVRITSGMVDVIVQAGKADPSLTASAAGSSAYAIIAIPRSVLDLSKPITFNLIADPGLVTFQGWENLVASPTRPPPTVDAAPLFRTVASFTSGAQQAQIIDGGKVLPFYLSVFSTQQQIGALNNRPDITDKLKGDLDKEVLLLVEWGASVSDGLQLDVTDVVTSPGMVDAVNIIVQSSKTDLSQVNNTGPYSAYAIIAIPRSALAFTLGKPVVFNVILDKGLVATYVWQP